LAFSVSQRTREIGVRVALGAAQKQIVRLFIGEGMRLAAVGVGIGLALGVAAAKALSSQFVGVQPTDVAVFASVAALLSLTAFVASLIPALRAARVDPMQALRYE
jgi:ABC-type antimicrobial peptide transport system permease subunit